MQKQKENWGPLIKNRLLNHRSNYLVCVRTCMVRSQSSEAGKEREREREALPIRRKTV